LDARRICNDATKGLGVVPLLEKNPRRKDGAWGTTYGGRAEDGGVTSRPYRLAEI